MQCHRMPGSEDNGRPDQIENSTATNPLTIGIVDPLALCRGNAGFAESIHCNLNQVNTEIAVYNAIGYPAYVRTAGDHEQKLKMLVTIVQY
jgi:hypothetical protein